MIGQVGSTKYEGVEASSDGLILTKRCSSKYEDMDDLLQVDSWLDVPASYLTKDAEPPN